MVNGLPRHLPDLLASVEQPIRVEMHGVTEVLSSHKPAEVVVVRAELERMRQAVQVELAVQASRARCRGSPRRTAVAVVEVNAPMVPVRQGRDETAVARVDSRRRARLEPLVVEEEVVAPAIFQGSLCLEGHTPTTPSVEQVVLEPSSFDTHCRRSLHQISRLARTQGRRRPTTSHPTRRSR